MKITEFERVEGMQGYYISSNAPPSGAFVPIEQVEQMRQAMQTFVNRVEMGEVRSTKTYNQFKEILS